MPRAGRRAIGHPEPPMPARPSRPLVLVSSAARREDLAPLQGLARIIRGADDQPMPRSAVLRHAPHASAIISQGELRIDAELLERSPLLRIVASASVGVDQLDLDAMARHGVFATNAPRGFVDATADYTLGAIIALLRRLPAADQYVRQGRWRRFQPGAWDGVLLRGKTLGLVGYGAIAREVERRARGFGLVVLHHCRTPTGKRGYRTLDELLASADIVSLHVPLNPDSRGLLNRSRLAQMKPGAFVVNVSRGPVIDEGALAAALRSGHLAGAALDVFAREPRVPRALLRAGNTLFTPHLGGGTREGRQESIRICAQNVALALAGRTPRDLQNRPDPAALRRRQSLHPA